MLLLARIERRSLSALSLRLILFKLSRSNRKLLLMIRNNINDIVQGFKAITFYFHDAIVHHKISQRNGFELFNKLNACKILRIFATSNVPSSLYQILSITINMPKTTKADKTSSIKLTADHFLDSSSLKLVE